MVIHNTFLNYINGKYFKFYVIDSIAGTFSIY
jgi:hypothetical protein